MAKCGQRGLIRSALGDKQLRETPPHETLFFLQHLHTRVLAGQRKGHKDRLAVRQPAKGFSAVAEFEEFHLHVFIHIQSVPDGRRFVIRQSLSARI